MSKPLMTTFPQDIKEVSSTQRVELGTLRITSDGRKYRYAKAGASALSVGKLGMAVAGVANHVNLTGSVFPTGVSVVSVTVGATAVAVNEYANGYLQINAGTAHGSCYRILAHGACDASGVLTLTLDRPLRVALDATSKLSMVHNPWYGITESATAAGNIPVGVAPCDVPAAYFYWAQTGGECAALMNGTPAVGTLLIAGAVAGSLAAFTIDPTASSTITPATQLIGVKTSVAGVDTEYGSVKLSLD